MTTSRYTSQDGRIRVYFDGDDVERVVFPCAVCGRWREGKPCGCSVQDQIRVLEARILKNLDRLARQ